MLAQRFCKVLTIGIATFMKARGRTAWKLGRAAGPGAALTIAEEVRAVPTPHRI
jgi:hypothetical protein